MEALYPGYSILFIFDNATSHSVYIEDILCVHKMNKRSGGKQAMSYSGWDVDQMGMYHIQPM